MGWLYIALLALAVAVLVGAEWPRLGPRFGLESRRSRDRARRKANLKLLRTEDDDFAASVERDLAQLPTIDESEHR
ncbi:MAG: hypothetical protein ABR569_09255 [Gaiellaceae bacterium]